MIIDQDVLDRLTEQAKYNSRLRCNLDLRNSPEDKSQRMLNAIELGTVLNIPAGQWHSLKSLESGTVLFEAKDGPYEPLGAEDIMSM